MNRVRNWILASLTPVLSVAQPSPTQLKPAQAQSSSTFNVSTAADGAQTIEIKNVTYEVATNVPGRPPADFVLLRKTTHSKEVIGDIGVEATVSLAAWRLGDDIHQRPLYTLSVSGTDGHTQDNALFVASRGLEETEWWSVYKLNSGQHLFDTYVPLVSFSVSRETVKMRYAGLDVPGDDVKDARLRQGNVIALLTYASEDRILREVLLTSDDHQQAAQLRSFADETRTLSAAAAGSSHVLKLSFSQNYPSPPKPVEMLIPVTENDLDLAHAQLPSRMHASAWKR